MSAIVAEGERLLAELQSLADEEAAEQAQAELEAQALAELRLTAPAILDLLHTVLARLSTVEQKVDAAYQAVCATRIRRPVRDELGTILYVVDEMQPPIWATPVSGPPTPD